jgi:hypothetical protein
MITAFGYRLTGNRALQSTVPTDTSAKQHHGLPAGNRWGIGARLASARPRQADQQAHDCARRSAWPCGPSEPESIWRRWREQRAC